MNGLLLLALSMVALAAAYVIYGRYLEKTWGIDPKAKTPAVANEDGVDFVPSRREICSPHSPWVNPNLRYVALVRGSSMR